LYYLKLFSRYSTEVNFIKKNQRKFYHIGDASGKKKSGTPAGEKATRVHNIDNERQEEQC